MKLASLVVSICVLASAASSQAQQSHPTGGQSPSEAAAQQPVGPTNDVLSQMRDDLNKMDSLNMNMSSEIEFLHDQNLQILLRTNSQMWTLLIRDLRRQIEATGQQRSAAPSEPKH